MDLKDFQQQNNIVDPNVKRMQMQQQGTQENSNITADLRGRQVVTPQQMGFTHEEPKKYKTPEEPILDLMDAAIARKQNEARLMANAIDESDGEGISEAEFQDLLVQANDEYNDADSFIPSEDELSNMPMKKEEFTSSLPEQNPVSSDLMSELEAEMEQDEADYNKEKMNNETSNDTEEDMPTQPSEEVIESIFEDFESGDINFDEEDEELSDDNIEDAQTLAEKEQKEQMDKLKSLIKEKIRPVSDAFDISSFSISNKPAPTSVSTPRAESDKIADWVLMNSQKPIYMKRFTGTEIERLSNGGKGRNRLNKAMDTWELIYKHIVDPHKPSTLEAWAKSTSFLDIDHIYMAIYRANFEGSNYIPYNCTNKNCKEKVFLSDNFDIMDMCKFSSKEAKAKFDSIIGTETNPNTQLYSTAIVPVSDDYAFVFREPSIYNVIFESAVLEQEFVEKFGDLVSICTYIDKIYYINKETRQLQPVCPNVYQNNMKKTVKSRIIRFSKIISELNSDQYNSLLAYMQKINTSSDELTYQLPAVTCPTCKTEIHAVKQEAQGLVFTRAQLVALATL